jgi:hypothetical protein
MMIIIPYELNLNQLEQVKKSLSDITMTDLNFEFRSRLKQENGLIVEFRNN